MPRSALAEAILAHVNEEQIVSMSCDLIDIPSPTGEEAEMGRYMRTVMEEMGLAVSWQEVEEGRANVVGLLEGRGGGKSLMFNGHMDTSYTGREPHLTGIGFKPKAVVKDEHTSVLLEFARGHGVAHQLGLGNEERLEPPPADPRDIDVEIAVLPA